LRALYNIAPIVPGHSLVVPGRHVVRLLDLDEHDLADLTVFARRISALLMEVFNATGIDWIMQDGPEAGQTVMHLHLHLIPRIEGDFESPGDWYPVLRTSQASAVDSEHRHRLGPEQLARAVARLRAAAAARG
jgi:bis(5'-adenosyl)-triphosphatase